MSISKSDIKELCQLVQNLYLEDEIPWVIGYSGGKDSTATLQLVWIALSELPIEQRLHKDVHVICTDTLVESPIITRWVDSSLEKISRHSAKNKDNVIFPSNESMPFIPHKLIPDYNDSFWVNLIGRGYPYPRANFRWCTDRLKIKPSNKFVKDVVSEYGEVILLLGTRKAESTNRAKTMQYYEKKRVREHLSPNGTMQNELVFSPLENWTDDDVWFFLMQYKNPWGHSNKELLTLYRGASQDGECPIVYDSDTPSCGKSRFGCWACTVVDKDKSMAAMILNDEDKAWMMPLLDFRNKIGDADSDKKRRDFRRMTGTTHAYKGNLVHGPYLKEVREDWLRELLKVEQLINSNGPPEYESLKLITDEELRIIRRIWLDEKHEFDDSLPEIYKEVTGKEFKDSWTNISMFGKREWELLKHVCNELYPDEKLLFDLTVKIIDIEQRSSNLKKRYGILKELDKQVSRHFFMNENDAIEYELHKERRKKQLGVKYNENAEPDQQQLSISDVGGVNNEIS